MPRLARRALRIDQFNTHFTRAEYRQFLTLAEAREQDPHAWLRDAIAREYRAYLRRHSAAVRAEIAARVEALLAEGDAEIAARRAQATGAGEVGTAPRVVEADPPRPPSRTSGGAATAHPSARRPRLTSGQNDNNGNENGSGNGSGSGSGAAANAANGYREARADEWERFRAQALAEDEDGEGESGTEEG